jgi:hypothetical protein
MARTMRPGRSPRGVSGSGYARASASRIALRSPGLSGENAVLV